MFSAPNGEVFQAGPSAAMHWITTSGAGSITSAGNRGDDPYAMNGNAVLYDVGMIMKTGGAPAYSDADAEANTYLIDINKGTAGVPVTKIYFPPPGAASHDGGTDTWADSWGPALNRPAPVVLSRRTFLQAAAGLVTLTHDHGRITPPTPVPDVRLVCQDGSTTSLGNLTQGRATAVQLMFTECSTTCPIQAAIFQKVQRLIPDMAASRIQLLSLSVDPATDTPKALSTWLGRFQATSSWTAAAPLARDGPLLQDFFGLASGNYAGHSTQVNIVDRRGRLVWRTEELPQAGEIARILRKV